MNALSRRQLALYALEQIRAADVLLATHREQIPVCSCGRPFPCTAEASIARRRQHYIGQLAQLGAPKVTARARVGGAVEGEITTPPHRTHQPGVER